MLLSGAGWVAVVRRRRLTPWNQSEATHCQADRRSICAPNNTPRRRRALRHSSGRSRAALPAADSPDFAPPEREDDVAAARFGRVRAEGALGACAVGVFCWVIGARPSERWDLGPSVDLWPARLWDGNSTREGRNARDSCFLRGRWALRAPEPVRWPASTGLSTWPASPSA